ncbi:MAG: DUF389 domain-containing protein [Chloroflexi bacterium]|nr:DUF389 domain-containing protein [Chloroflexota bacterium]
MTTFTKKLFINTRPLSSQERMKTFTNITRSSTANFDYFLLVILSAVIATFGLLTDSAAVVIGSMLVAPLLPPILGIGLGTAIGESRLVRRSFLTLTLGAGLAIVLAAIITVISRFMPIVDLQTLPAEVMARTQPSLFDLGIALAGGLAVAYAYTRPNLSSVMYGAAIATALMPPLATIGIGLAVLRWDVISGATLLFVTNALTISFASGTVFLARGFTGEINDRRSRVFRRLVTLVLPLLAVFIFLL